MDYMIFKNGQKVNRIVADEAFCQRHYAKDGYSFQAVPAQPEMQPTIDELRGAKLQEAGEACSAAIYAGWTWERATTA